MFSLTASQFMIVLEAALILGGLIALWRLALSPAARAAGRPPARLAAWPISLSDFLLFLFLTVIGGFVVQLIANLIAGRHFDSLVDGATLRLLAVGGSLDLGMLAGMFCFHLHQRPRRAENNPAPSAIPISTLVPAGLLTFLLALPVIYALSYGWTQLLELLGLPAGSQDLVELLTHAHSLRLPLVLGLLAVIVAPVTEELLFRAGLYRYLRTRMPRWAALVFTSALFAALHMNLASFLPLTALGVIFCLAYERTGRIGVSMIAHALFNLNTILLVLAGFTR